MSNPVGLIVVAPFAWGLYKCSVLAQRPATNKKALYALATMLGVWLVVLAIAVISPVAEGDARLLIAGALLFAGAPVAAVVLAVLGLREIRLGKRSAGREAIDTQGTWQAALAVVLASALLVPFTAYGGRRLFGTRGQQAETTPRWTAFTSPQGDFEIQFPSVPEEAETGSSGGGASFRAFSTTHGPATYGVTVREDPAASVAGAEAAFDTWEKGIAERLPGRVLNRITGGSGSVATREVRGVSPAKGEAYRFRAVVTDRHMYVLAAIMPETADQREVVDRFFESFTLRSTGSTR